MAITRGVKDPRAALIASAAIVLAIVLSVGGIGSQQVGASLFPVNVRGFVTDAAQTPLHGANVTVEMVNESTGLPTKTLYYDTLSNGFYTVTFEAAVWNPGDTIRVTASYGGDSNQNSTLAVDAPVQYVNVTLLTVVPEFGDFLGSPMSVVSVGLIAIMIVMRRRRRGNEPVAPP